MATNIISSFNAFSEKFDIPKEGERSKALERYFARGGVISAVKAKGKWPKLVYPSPLRIESQIKELQELREHYAKKAKGWKSKLDEANSYHQRHQLLKFSDPLYWKHVAKTVSDSDYSADVKSVKLPVHLVADPKWKPMVKMFVNDIEYRKNLVETVQNSIVYKKDKKVAKYADVLQEFRSEMSSSKLEELKEKTGKLDEDIKALETIKKWAKE